MPHDKQKGFPVIKVLGHIVNHLEWKDGAIIVTVDNPERERCAKIAARYVDASTCMSCTDANKIMEDICSPEVTA